MNNKQTQIKPAKTVRKLDIEKIMEQADKLKKAEIEEKKWLKKHQAQQVF